MDLCGLQFFHRCVLNRNMDWVIIVRSPRIRTLPEIPTREEVQRLINTVKNLRYRVFFLSSKFLGQPVLGAPLEPFARIGGPVAQQLEKNFGEDAISLTSRRTAGKCGKWTAWS